MEGAPKNYLYHMVPKDMRPNEEGKNILYPLNMLKEKFPDLYEVKAEKYSEPQGDDVKKNEERKSIPGRLIPTLEQAAWGDVLNLTAIHPQELMDALQSAGFTPQEMKFYQIDPDLLDPELATIYLYREEAGGKEDPNQYQKFDPDKLHEHSSIPEKTKEYYKQRHEDGKRPLLFVGIPHILYKGHLDVSDIEKFPVITAVPSEQQNLHDVDLRTIDNGRLISPSLAEGPNTHKLDIEEMNIPVSFTVLPDGHFRLNGLQEGSHAGLVMSGFASGAEAKINHVIVDSELRQAAKQSGNIRIGEAAIADLEKNLEEQGVTTLYAIFYTPETIDFFRRNGYEIMSVDSLGDDIKLRLGIDSEGFATQIKDDETFEKLRPSNPEDYRHVLLKKIISKEKTS